MDDPQPMTLKDMDNLADLAIRAAADQRLAKPVREYYERVASNTINYRVEMYRAGKTD